MAISKARGAHGNLVKLQLTCAEAGKTPGNNPTHRDVLQKISVYNTMLITKVKEFAEICCTHTIPGLNAPTTADHLRKKIVTDIGVNTFGMLTPFVWNVTVRSHFIQMVSLGFGDAPSPRKASLHKKCLDASASTSR
jgi:hypothetical protein